MFQIMVNLTIVSVSGKFIFKVSQGGSELDYGRAVDVPASSLGDQICIILHYYL